MKAKYLFDMVEQTIKNGGDEIWMCLNYGQPFGIRYHGTQMTSAALFGIIKDLMNDKGDGNVCISFEKTSDGIVRDINIDICDDSHRYGMCVDSVRLTGDGMLISVRETSGE